MGAILGRKNALCGTPCGSPQVCAAISGGVRVRFNRRFDLPDIIPRLVYVALRTLPMLGFGCSSYAWLDGNQVRLSKLRQHRYVWFPRPQASTVTFDFLALERAPLRLISSPSSEHRRLRSAVELCTVTLAFSHRASTVTLASGRSLILPPRACWARSLLKLVYASLLHARSSRVRAMALPHLVCSHSVAAVFNRRRRSRICRCTPCEMEFVAEAFHARSVRAQCFGDPHCLVCRSAMSRRAGALTCSRCRAFVPSPRSPRRDSFVSSVAVGYRSACRCLPFGRLLTLPSARRFSDRVPDARRARPVGLSDFAVGRASVGASIWEPTHPKCTTHSDLSTSRTRRTRHVGPSCSRCSPILLCPVSRRTDRVYVPSCSSRAGPFQRPAPQYRSLFLCSTCVVRVVATAISADADSSHSPRSSCVVCLAAMSRRATDLTCSDRCRALLYRARQRVASLAVSSSGFSPDIELFVPDVFSPPQHDDGGAPAGADAPGVTALRDAVAAWVAAGVAADARRQATAASCSALVEGAAAAVADCARAFADVGCTIEPERYRGVARAGLTSPVSALASPRFPSSFASCLSAACPPCMAFALRLCSALRSTEPSSATRLTVTPGRGTSRSTALGPRVSSCFAVSRVTCFARRSRLRRRPPHSLANSMLSLRTSLAVRRFASTRSVRECASCSPRLRRAARHGSCFILVRREPRKPWWFILARVRKPRDKSLVS